MGHSARSTTRVQRSRPTIRTARRTFLALTTALCTGLAAPAFAGSPHPNLDANGVDLTDGTFNLRLPIASVGAGEGRLTLVAYDGQTDNWSQISAYRTANGFITVSLGPDYDNFSSADGFASSIRGTGATLTINSDSSYTYRTIDGIVIEFGNPNASGVGGSSNLCDTGSSTDCTLLPLSITGRSGMSELFGWDVFANCSGPIDPQNPPVCTYSWRLGSVSNEAGYRIDWTFAAGNPSTGNPGSNWFRRTSAVLGNDAVAGTRTVTYGQPSSNVFTITTPGNKTWRITGQGSAITGVRRPSASADTTVISYASPGVVSSVTRDGVTANYSRSVSGNTATETVTDAQAHTTTIVSDMAKYRPTSLTDALNHTTSFAYDPVGRLKEITYHEGNKVAYDYDARGNLIETRIKAKPSLGGADLVSSALYPATCTPALCNQPVWTKDAKGNQTDYSYDPDTGLATTITAPAPSAGATRPQVRYTYSDQSGSKVLTGVSTCQAGAAPACVGTADEVRQTLGYDANLNLTSATIVAGDGSVSATTARTFDAAGNLVTVDGALTGTADTTTWRWSADREMLGVISADPGLAGMPRRAVKMTYNGDGQLKTTELGTVTGTSDAAWSAFSSRQQVTATFDGNARKTRDDLTGGGSTYGVNQYSYDPLGRSDCTAVRMNPAVFGSLPGACAQGAQGTDGADRITQTQYDEVGRVRQVDTGIGTADARTAMKRTFTPNGQVESETDGESNRTSYNYDAYDRLQKTSYPLTTRGANASSGSDYEQLGYDANGNVTSRRLRDGQTIGYTYDALDQRTFDDNPGTNIADTDVTYTYDNLGRLTRAGDANGWYGAFEYDALGRVRRQYSNLSSNRLDYDPAGRLARQTWSDGFYVDYGYLTTGEMRTITEQGGLVLATFGYDDLGRRNTLTRANGTSTSYHYDAVSRMDQLAQDLAETAQDLTLGFGYNAAGQIRTRAGSNDLYVRPNQTPTTLTYTPDGLNRYAQASLSTPTYDGRGNTASFNGQSYSYNTRNELYTNGAGQLFYRNPLGLLNIVPGFLFDYVGADLATEIDGSTNQIARRYVYGPGSDEPLVQYEGSGTSDRRWLHADERGSVIAITNGSGSSIATNTYNEHGQPGTNNQGRFQYTGQKWIAELGLYDYKARMYAPGLGRFMQTDPIGYADGMNWYAYVAGDPVNHIDPTGLDCGDADSANEAGCAVVVTAKRINSAAPLSTGGIGIATGTWSFDRDLLTGNEPSQADSAQSGDIVVTGPPPQESGSDVTVTARRSPLIQIGAQRGGQNMRSTEFRNLSDEEVKAEYDSSSGERRVKLQRELKARGLHGGGKVRGGGLFRSPLLLMTPNIQIEIYRFVCRIAPESDPNCRIA